MACDYELIVRTRHGTSLSEPPDVQVFRRAVYLHRLASEGWEEARLEDINERLDRQEVIPLQPGVFLRSIDFSVRDRQKVELGNGQGLYKP